MQKASQCPLALTADRCLASLTSTCSEPFVFFELDDWFPPDVPLLLALVADEFDLILNLRKLSPCEPDEPDDSLPGMNFKPTIISPRYVVTSSNGSL